MHDSIDGDDINMGSTQAMREETIEADILVTFEGDFEKLISARSKL